MLDCIRVRDRSVGELVELSSLIQPGVSKHLQFLREAGLVIVRNAARKRLYCLNAKPLKQIHDWFEPYRRFWNGKLDDLERFFG
ncbi:MULTISPECIES: ArsR/SmtB family transcription factor [Paenibacillus]|uniref:ArsR/SmtB family transcription factor n=1 Tax=Paenibacillus TaxID=44249 RepID=UPI0022A79227|nr:MULTISPECIES: ArsR family transcriptional regulator [Paenibacillus]